jgi:molybdenum cofactor cytidylyltransferase
MSDIAAIILAAGRSTRFNAGDADATKLVALWRGEPMVRCVARNALASGAAPVIVVTGHAHRVIEQALAGLALRIVHNDAFRNGLSSSLRAGIAALPPNVDGALAMLGDMPLVSAQTLRHLMEAHKAAPPNCRALIPLYSGKRGNPVLLARGIFLDIAHLCGDEGARALLRATADVVCVNVDDPGVLVDIDARDDLQRR